jgi:hypothetical protein
MRRLLLTAIAILVSPLALGQDDTVDEAPEIRRYTVEVIIFGYAEEVSVGTEMFLPDAPVIEDFDAEPAGDFVFGDAITEPPPDALEEEFTDETEPDASVDEFILHIEDEFTLGDIASRLERLDVYEPIMHFAWTQETRPEEETRPIDLAELGPPPDGLSGSFTLYLSRYLHLVVDLTLDEAPALTEPVAIDDSVFSFSDPRSGYAVEAPERGAVRFRIEEDRIFKNGDLRYFDHPKFGVLAKITRVEEEEHEVEPEMLGDGPAELSGGVSQ